MDRIRELVGRITTLSAEELTELRGLLSSEFETLDTDEATVDDIAVLQELAGFSELLMGQEAERAAAQEQAQADRQAARERIQALNPPAEPETDPEADPAADPANPEDPAAAEPAATPAVDAVPEPVAASGQVARMAARQGTPTPSPEATPPTRNRAVLVAAGALRGRLDPSQPITDRMELATAMAETLQRMNRSGAPMGSVLVASATWQYPEERKLGGDAWENTRKIENVTGLQALTATGGICAPTNVDYAVPTWASADRPLRDALPGFDASRGGILFVQPPDIAALAGATAIWSEATDASPGASMKPIIQVSCGSTTQEYVEAVSTRLGFGNMQARFAPEQVAANTDLAAAAAARIAENNLLNLMAARCVQNVQTAVMLGASRDLLVALHQAVAAFRSAHRIPDSQTLTAVFPAWLRGLIKIDLLRELAHGQTSDWNTMAITDAQVNELFTNTGVNPVWHLDGQPTGVSGGVAQVFAIQGGAGNILTFPSKLVWYLYPEGMFQFLDAGRLDLGVVRDSTLDATNDYETFFEVFEGLAYRGFASGAYQFVSSLCASGASSATIGSVTCA